MPIHHNLLGAQLVSTERIFRPIADEARGAKYCSAYENVVVGGATVPMHRHAVEEIIVCLSGTAECTFEGGTPGILCASARSSSGAWRSRWGCSESARAPVVHGDRAVTERFRRD